MLRPEVPYHTHVDGWPNDAVLMDYREAAVEERWPGTIKPYRGFGTREDYDEAVRQLEVYGNYSVIKTDDGMMVVPRDQ